MGIFAWRYISLYTKLFSFFLPELLLRVIFVILLVYFCFLFHLVCLNDCVLHILFTSSSFVCVGVFCFLRKKIKTKKVAVYRRVAPSSQTCMYMYTYIVLCVELLYIALTNPPHPPPPTSQPFLSLILVLWSVAALCWLCFDL